MSMDVLTPLSRQMEAVLACLSDEYDRALSKLGLHAPQAAYILAICQNPSQPQDALASLLNVNRSSITRQLADLEAKGFVRRVRNQADRRECLVEPTDRAFDVLPRLVDIRNDCQSALLRGLSREEQELLCELMARVARNADRHRTLTAQELD